MLAVADLGGAPDARPPMYRNFFNFMGFFRKCINILGRRTPKGLALPPMTSPGSSPGCVIYEKHDWMKF